MCVYIYIYTHTKSILFLHYLQILVKCILKSLISKTETDNWKYITSQAQIKWQGKIFGSVVSSYFSESFFAFPWRKKYKNIYNQNMYN